MFCSKCGKEILSGNNVCEHCGAEVEELDMSKYITTEEVNNQGYENQSYSNQDYNANNQGYENQSYINQDYNANNQGYENQSYSNQDYNANNQGYENQSYSNQDYNNNQGYNNQQYTNQGYNNYQGGAEQKSKLAAGLLAIFVGSLGIHNFYLGYTNKGLIQILVTLIGGIVTCGISAVAMQIWAIVEGIQILTGSINVDANGVPLKE